MLNNGNLKRYLATGKSEEPYIKGLPRSFSRTDDVAQDESDAQIAKTLLKKSLAEHDSVYHNPSNKGQHAYKTGDTCNFRQSLMKGDGADTLVVKEKPREAEKLGLVKFKETSGGKKEIVGIKAIEDVRDLKTAVNDQESMDWFFDRIFDRSAAARKGWETRKRNGLEWRDAELAGVRGKDDVDLLSNLPTHLTRRRFSRSEYDANMDLALASDSVTEEDFRKAAARDYLQYVGVLSRE